MPAHQERGGISNWSASVRSVGSEMTRCTLNRHCRSRFLWKRDILTESRDRMRRGKQVRTAAVSSWSQHCGCSTDLVALQTFDWLTTVLVQAEEDQATPPAKFAAPLLQCPGTSVAATDVRSHAMSQVSAGAYAYQSKPVAGAPMSWPMSWAEGFVQKPWRSVVPPAPGSL